MYESVNIMEASSQVVVESCESMEVPEQKVSKVKTPMVNLVTGVFLKSIFFLNPECSKYILVGVFSDHGNSVGILFKSPKGVVFLTPLLFNQFIVYVNQVTEAFDRPGVHRFSTDSGEDIVVKKVFGKRYAKLFDGHHTITLLADEWTQFTNSLPCISRQVNELFLCEDLLRSYIIQVLASDEEYETAPQGIPPHLCDRLFDEIQYYKRWPNVTRSRSGISSVSK